MDKNKIRSDVFNFLGYFGSKIKTKFTNICGKTGQYDVPGELFQKRTSRSNRVLISWKAVRNNNLTLEQLKSFSGGVVVEFVNEDFFDKSNEIYPTFKSLRNSLGSDELVSSIISIRSETGSSSSAMQRRSFNILVNNTKINYKGKDIILNKSNYQDFAIKQLSSGGTGNEKWEGFLFISIRGGQQDTIETHRGKDLTIFNPACEFATKEVGVDLDLVMSYFALLSIDVAQYDNKIFFEYQTILNNLRNSLKNSLYDSESYKGNLLDYVDSHPSIRMVEGELTDPIQIRRIDIKNFNVESRNQNSIDFTHNEAVVKQKFYWDKVKNCILSAARPTNAFWSFHLSNMMQQDFDLEAYFAYEEKRYKKRQELLKGTSKNLNSKKS